MTKTHSYPDSEEANTGSFIISTGGGGAHLVHVHKCKAHSGKCARSSSVRHCGNLGAGGTLLACGIG